QMFAPGADGSMTSSPERRIAPSTGPVFASGGPRNTLFRSGSSQKAGGMADVAQILIDAVERRASDIVIKAGNSPLARIDGELLPLYPDAGKLMPPDTEAMARQLMPEYRIREFESEQEADFAYAVPGLGRFRVNAFRQRGSTSMVLRTIPMEAPTFEE